MSSDATKNNTDVDKQYSNGGWVPIDSKAGNEQSKAGKMQTKVPETMAKAAKIRKERP